jgi:hypothetical protein
MWLIAKGRASEQDDQVCGKPGIMHLPFRMRRKFMKLGIAWLSELRDETRISRERLELRAATNDQKVFSRGGAGLFLTRTRFQGTQAAERNCFQPEHYPQILQMVEK